MHEKIPYLNEPQVQEEYLKVLSDLLGNSGKLHISRAAITPALIVNKKIAHQHCATYPDGIDRIYILGIPASEKRTEQRGIGIMCAPSHDFYYKFIQRGFVETHQGFSTSVLKRLDMTAELVAELRQLESLVFSD